MRMRRLRVDCRELQNNFVMLTSCGNGKLKYSTEKCKVRHLMRKGEIIPMLRTVMETRLVVATQERVLSL